PVHGQADELVVSRGDVVRFLIRNERDDLARLVAPASPEGAFVPRQDGSEPKAAGGRGALRMKPPVAGYPQDLDPSELKDLEFAPERPAADLPEAMIPAAEPLGQFVKVAGAQRLQKHEPSPAAIVAKLQFSDLIVPIAELAWKSWRRKRLARQLP